MILAWKYVRFYKARSLAFVLILSLVMAMPFISHTISQSLSEQINSRAESSPVLVARRAGKIRQSLSALFFVGDAESDLLSFGRFESLTEKDGVAIPLIVKHQTRYAPLVATEIDYFSFRSMELAAGTFFALPGDIVLGSAVARNHSLAIGDKVTIQSADPYDITNSAPLELQVTGLLLPSSGPDDDVIFTSLRTSWIVDGHLHSHSEEDRYKEVGASEVTYSKSLRVEQRVSESNLLDFHFHGDPDELPITHVIFRGNTHKAEVLLMDEINQNPQLMAYRPEDSLESVANVFLRLDRFLSIYHLFWAVCTTVMATLIFGLIVQARRDEFAVLVSLGASDRFVWINVAQLIGIYLGLSAGVASFWFLLSQLIWRSIFL